VVVSNYHSRNRLCAIGRSVLCFTISRWWTLRKW